jgi:hypothetical protein
MEPLELHSDFKDFLKLLNSAKVEYLLIGGYAVGSAEVIISFDLN